MTNTPEQTAKELIEAKFPIEQYQKVQDRRNERLTYWKTVGVKALIEQEKELVAFGEKVMQIMNEHYKQK